MGPSRIARFLNRFWRDRRGTAGTDFVTTVPLMIGALMMSVEYGKTFAAREALDTAVRDATRLMARAPAGAGTDSGGATVPAPYPFFETQARSLIESRIGQPLKDVTAAGVSVPAFEVTFERVDETNFRDPFYRVTMTAATSINAPLLWWLDYYDYVNASSAGTTLPEDERATTDFPIIARDTARYVSAVPLGATACSYIRAIEEGC